MKTKFFLSAFLMIFSLTLLSQWSNDPAVNNAIATVPGEEAIPKVATTASGITYVSWFSVEAGNYNVRLQKFDVYGNELWADGGILISDNAQETWLTDWDMTVDQADHAILVWNDIRTGNWDVFAYRISPEGDFIWGDNGIQLSSSQGGDAAPKVTVTNVGNAVVAWQELDAGVIIGQKIAPDGTLQWGPNGLTLSGANTYSWPQLMPVGEDDIIMKFFDDSGPVWAPTRHVYAQRFSGSGTMVWPQPAVISEAGGISAWTQIFPFINDGSDGFFIAWHDDRDNNMLANMWVQHIGSDGSVLFADDGVEVSTMTGRNHFYAHLALPAGSEDIFIFWNEMDANQNDRGIYGQKVSSAGNRLWPDDGKKFIEISSTNVYPLAGRSTGADIILFYEEYFDVVSGKIKAMRLDTDGNLLWTPNFVDMCTVQSEKVHTVVSEMNNGQFIAAWEDSRNGGRDIYGQNIKLDGTLGPIPSGELIFTPDTVYCEVIGPHFAFVINGMTENVVAEDVYFENGWYVYFENLPALPYTISPDDSLTIEFYVIPGSVNYNPEYYEYDKIFIQSSLGLYHIDLAINGDLLGSVNSIQKGNDFVKLFPNPFTQFLSFEFNCKNESIAEITIISNLGSIVMTSENFNCNAGKNTYLWNGKTNSGVAVPAGVYTYRLKLNDRIISGRILKTQ
jgi:hypothetical protein